MKLWEENSFFMIIWKNGFRYESKLHSNKKPSEILQILKQNFTSKTIVKESENDISFEGGYRWVSKYLSAFILGPERWLYHTVDINISNDGEIALSYEIKGYLMMLIYKISFQKEVKKLQDKL